ncbi:LysR family transcriptional regulator [Bradyrhizobium sp. LHD-71]|uniref:LysR family transcriptional regulator n=1 Tax=Bradyrhizobium sp. LHD-71 TaxID=3072141 RepID=UPI00280E44D8|nr:LysR family transcriptional regulator [Bradyrhizobium sp. LHD-71]MDQ8726590.1 LysR family transcriptional regulator [Bradyrhizobium sp. LHD-71]
MQQVVQRGAASAQQAEAADVPDALWDDLHVFLVCAEHRSFRRAADVLGLTNTTLMRRMDRLEHQLGTKLFVRHQSGLLLSDAGKSILDDVKEMERLSFNVRRAAAQAAAVPTGLVRVAVTEGPGTYWVLPRLIDFQNTYQTLTVDLRCAMEQADVTRLEADIAIQLEKPRNPELICTRLGRLHIYPFASEVYVRNYGLPASPTEWQFHRIVVQVAPQLDESAYARVLGLETLEGVTGIRTNSSTATLYAVERGAGIGFLPSCAKALGAPLVPVTFPFNHNMDLWLTYHRDLKNSQPHMIVVDWLRRIFDSKTYPCFRDEFIHPNDLVPMMEGAREAVGIEGYTAPRPL